MSKAAALNTPCETREPKTEYTVHTQGIATTLPVKLEHTEHTQGKDITHPVKPENQGQSTLYINNELTLQIKGVCFL